jgi:hypothetical protein
MQKIPIMFLKLMIRQILKKNPFQEKSLTVIQNFQKTFSQSSENHSTNQRKISPEIPLRYHRKQKQITVQFKKLKVSSVVMILTKLPAEEKASEDRLSHPAYSGPCI